MLVFSPNPTFCVELPGGQDRLRELILYVADRCRGAERFGGIKLNKILWRSDFAAFASRGVPVTGRPYQRLRSGPAPEEMVPLHRDMRAGGLITVEHRDCGDGIVEHRTIPLRTADMAHFDSDDTRFVDAAIACYWTLTGMEANDESHGIAWRTREDGDPMPYESALLSDRIPGPAQMRRLRQLIYDRGLLTQ